MTFTIPRPEWVSDDTVTRRGENAGFQMYTREGNDAVAEMLTRIFAESQRLGCRRLAVIDAVVNGVREVSRVHPEIHDTEPEWAITDAVNAYFDTEDWTHVSREDVT